MELKLSCLNWRKSKTMRKCQKPLNSLSRNMGPYAGPGTLGRDRSLQRQGSGRMSDTTCQSSGSHLHPDPSFCPWPQGQTLRKRCRGRCRCPSGSREKCGPEFLGWLMSCGLAGWAVPPLTLQSWNAPVVSLIPEVIWNRIVKGAECGAGSRAAQFRTKGLETLLEGNRCPVGNVWTAENRHWDRKWEGGTSRKYLASINGFMKLSTVQRQGCGPVRGLPGPWPPHWLPLAVLPAKWDWYFTEWGRSILGEISICFALSAGIDSQLSVSKDRISFHRPLKFSFRWRKGFFRIAHFWEKKLSFLLERENFRSRSSRALIQLCMLPPCLEWPFCPTFLFWVPLDSWLLWKDNFQVTSSCSLSHTWPSD